jgi:LacI family transcriptional regulator, repressor for deo operon, udp, cdd, tsx, nupC, and nupG
MAATLRDVAALAGVSVKTVSNVVNGYAFVRPENRRRVEEALAATGYRPHLGARNLRRGRTGFLALMVPELGIPYFAELAALVITAAHAHEWNVLIEQTRGTREQERSTLASLGPHLIDGAIISPEALHADDLAAADTGVPVVMLGEHDVDVAIDRVAIDNVGAARTAVEHLLGLGRRRVAAIGDNPRRGTAALRLRGYREALEAAGLPVDPGLVAPAESYHRRDGAEAMRALLARPDPPDAVFCFNDLLAVGALRAAAEHGCRVPHDLAVVGFDGSEEGAYSTPTLSTVAPDKAAIAERAVERVAARVAGTGDGTAQEIVTPFRLEVRESTTGRAP